MPSRFRYWTIVVGNESTAFRANDRDELLPTLKQLQTRHPEAELKWFERGKYWAAPSDAERPPAPRDRYRRRLRAGRQPKRRRRSQD